MRTVRRVLDSVSANITSTSVAVVAGAVGVAVTGLMVIAFYAWTVQAAQIFAMATMLALGGSAVGGLAGFLFGLPRYTSVIAISARGDNDEPTTAVTAPLSRESSSAARAYAPSTNLEQVSDWLTKLLLGAGLVQIGEVGQWLSGLINSTATAFGTEVNEASARLVAGSIIALYPIVGFVFVYMCTTLWYRTRLQRIEET